MRSIKNMRRWWGAWGLATLLLCSCQTVTTRPAPKAVSPDSPPIVDAVAAPDKTSAQHESAPASESLTDAVEPAFVASAPVSLPVAPCPTCPPGLPAALPASAFGPPWNEAAVRPPYEEFVCNGGDQNVQVQVKRDWSVQGLHDGDTVVHYDTIDGRTLVEPSNEVCLYAPRFAAVRKVYGLVAHESHDRAAGVELPVGAELSSDLGEPTIVSQQLQPGRKHTVTAMQAFNEKTRGIGLENAVGAVIAEEAFLPFEDLVIIRRGVFDNTEKARLAERLAAAVAWTHGQAPQVTIDNRNAIEDVGITSTQSVYTYVLPPGKSRLRVVKIASKQNAKPGELVEFTLRFDNVGDQLIGNVTVIDRLHDRLEYVPDTQRCSLESNFLTQEEDGSARVLRWEITAPMKVGEGGLIRFTCRVR